MTLQDLFKEYYSKAKSVDAKDYVNSAKTSLNSFSSLLEKRRQKAQKKDEPSTSQKPAEEVKQEDAAKQEFSQTATPQEGEAPKEQAKEQQAEGATAEEEAKKEEKVRWAKKVKQSFESKTQVIGEKYPKAASAVNYLKVVWSEAFPNEQGNALSKMEKRKEQARLQKEYEENKEYIDNIQEQIPDWKKGAVVVSDKQAEEEKAGLLKKLGQGVKSKISSTEAGKQFMESEQYKKIEQLRSEMKEFKTNLKEEIDNTQNPVIRTTRDVTDMVLTESNHARAVKEMLAYDPEFDLGLLQFEMEEIFKEFYCNFLEGNLPYLEKVCAGPGLAFVKGNLKVREVEKWKHRYTDIIDITDVNFIGGQVPEKSPPQFTFTIEIQEMDCKVLADGTIHSGADDRMMKVAYRVILSRRDEPDIATTGHYWEIVECSVVNQVKQLI